MRTASFELLFSGGLSGNLGVVLGSTFLIILPNLCLLVKSLMLRFYFLRFLQYPGLLTFAFIIFVFFLRQDKWVDLGWRGSLIEFAIALSSFTTILSLILIRHSQSKLLIAVPVSFVLGLILLIVF